MTRLRLLFLSSFLLILSFAFADTILVRTIDELHAAAKKAQPRDRIILQNGEWNNVTIKLKCNGTKEKPIVFAAQTAGKVKITGNSQLRLGGSYIVVDGLYFTNGYAGSDPVINFRADKDNVANNCRVTNTVVDNFNNLKRMQENYWVSFYGKNNRLDHCSFKDKKNMGVLLAVILDDERSRENFHSIDHNYFGRRPALASNSGEIIRVGVSQHCQFNSNTQITDNFFEECDGETEIVSIKSGSNVVRGNVFKESQGSVVLRHGDNNTVENNVFLGNGKAATGGVRVINKGQWVVNNFFYKCRGVDFRSPLSVMNGIPNSPAHRYVQVTDAVIANNTFVDCTPISLCEGSDAERTLPPANTYLVNNLFYNTSDKILHNVYDKADGFSFAGNEVSPTIKQDLLNGFVRTTFSSQKNDGKLFPVTKNNRPSSALDSINRIAGTRLTKHLSAKPGFSSLALIKQIQANAFSVCGAKWFQQTKNNPPAIVQTVACRTADDVYAQLNHNKPVIIELTGTSYQLTSPFTISKQVQFTTKQKTAVKIITAPMLAAFVVSGNGNLTLSNLSIDGKELKATYFISSDSAGLSSHYNLSVRNCSISNLSALKGCKSLFYAHKSIIADSIIFRNNNFSNHTTNMISMAEEKDDKGYYNAEKIVISQNVFSNNNGTLLNIYRGGNDESTLGPNLLFSNNKISNCSTAEGNALITLTGVQVSRFVSNVFTNVNSNGTVFQFKDIVRAKHLVEKNVFDRSGTVTANQFVVEKENVTK